MTFDIRVYRKDWFNQGCHFISRFLTCNGRFEKRGVYAYCMQDAVLNQPDLDNGKISLNLLIELFTNVFE